MMDSCIYLLSSAFASFVLASFGRNWIKFIRIRLRGLQIPHFESNKTSHNSSDIIASDESSSFSSLHLTLVLSFSTYQSLAKRFRALVQFIFVRFPFFLWLLYDLIRFFLSRTAAILFTLCIWFGGGVGIYTRFECGESNEQVRND